ncbi:ComEC/Rec2 family competence protein [Thermosulfurimonas sp. F29]|uniref:ComEC/Rec2 family competence protein n=1 Tax=Thermosulfurimonas sp. F29 TaxID=2867247 RepID=UPI001C83CCE4|nr:ComEC/Rec2 family competence protein [Thermosulfurimonas sp. F29]MBX6423156.1 ComEC/Rec2 family competence protein [Thermosulfurimonas sp. F29]
MEGAAGFWAGLLLALWHSPAWILIVGVFFGAVLRRAVMALALSAGFFYGTLYLGFLPSPPPQRVLLLEGRIEVVRPLEKGEALVVKSSYGRGEIFVGNLLPECLPGAHLRARVRVRHGGYLNPFSPGPEVGLLSRGLSFRAYAKTREVLCYGEGSDLLSRARERLLFFARGLSPPAGGLLAALVLGEKGLLPSPMRDEVRRRGIYHFLAVSGFHLGLLFAGLYGIVRRLWPRFFARPDLPAQIPALLAGLLGAVLYAALSGFPTSAVRALTMLSLYTLARLLFRRTTGSDLLAGTVLVLLIAFPGNALDLSFRLSVFAVGGVLLAYRLSDPFLASLRPLMRYPLRALAVSLGAWLLTLPFLLYTFGEVPLLGPLYTLLFSPLWCFILIPGEITVALLAPFFREAASGLAEILGRIFELSLTLPLPSPTLRPPFPVGLFVLFLILFGTGILWTVKGKRGKAIPAFLFAFLMVILGIRVRESLFYLLVLDLGKANAVLVHLPGNRNLLFDAGARFGDFDAGRWVTAPVPRKLGIKEIDLVVLSHPDLDHTGGLPALAEEFYLRHVLSGIFRRASWEKVGWMGDLEELSSPQALRIRGAEVFLLPGRPFPENENRESLVAYLEYRGLTIFFPGDIDRVRLRRLSGEGGLLPAEIFVLPHHGARNGLWPPAWTKIHPAVALAQARGIRHPHPVVRKWLAARGVPLYVTGERGALFVFLKDGGFLICSEEGLRGGLPKALLWPYIPYVTGRGCDEYTLHSLRNL